MSVGSRVADNVEILNVRFLGISASTSSEFGHKIPEEVNARIGFTPAEYRIQDRTVVATTTFMFRLTADSRMGPPVFQIKIDTEVIYLITGESELGQNELDAFAKLNAPFNAWAYWREAVHSALNRMDLPSFPIPLLRASQIARHFLDAKGELIRPPKASRQKPID